MLLFTDGFECARPKDIFRKWGIHNGGGSISDSSWKIVSGVDNTVSPPHLFARRIDGRALYVDTDSYHLYTHFRKSRTVFLGFGFRYRRNPRHYNPGFVVKFYTRAFPGFPGIKTEQKKGNLVATCTFTLRGNYADTKWEFPSDFCHTQYGQVNANASLWNGDWHYLQFGITLHGNNPGGATAWVENRIGSNEVDKIDNIYTAAPESENSYYINAIEIIPWTSSTLDDVYICNDEGDVNNSFLGPVHIRSVIPEVQGSINQGQPVNTSSVDRAQAVNAGGFIGTYEQIPADPPTPEEDQHFVAWQDPREQYLRLPREGSTQTFDFSNPNFAGSEPKFFGAMSYMMVRPGYYDLGFTSIEPVMLSGLNEIQPSAALRKPVMYLFDNEWEIRRGIFENHGVNNNTGFLSDTWNRTAISNAEWGLRVVRHEDNPESYLPEYLRVKYVFDDELSDSIRAIDDPMRYWEEQSTFNMRLDSESSMDLTYAIYDALGLSESGSDGIRGMKCFVNSIAYLKDEIPWQILFVNDQIGFDDGSNVTWAQIMEEAFGLADDAEHWWIEEIQDGLEVESSPGFVFALKALDDLELDDPIRSNHELVADSLHAEVTHIWSNHEYLEETLYPVADASMGVLIEALDGFGLEEEHYDGWYVAVVPHQFSTVDSVLTQHWRHDVFMGIFLSSWQVGPIEQSGNDGDRTGSLLSEFWNQLGYYIP